jgi:zinc-ribbon domain
MHCPSCGQQQVSSDLRFCSRCGMPLTAVAEILANGGMLPMINPQKPLMITSAKKRGLKQGGIMMLLGVFIVPVLGIVIGLLLEGPTELVGLAALFFFLGGFLRMIYAAIFEDGTPTFLSKNDTIIPVSQMNLGGIPVANALPPPQSIPVNNTYQAPNQNPLYAPGNWRSTTDLLNKDGSEKATQMLDDMSK